MFIRFVLGLSCIKCSSTITETDSFSFLLCFILLVFMLCFIYFYASFFLCYFYVLFSRIIILMRIFYRMSITEELWCHLLGFFSTVLWNINNVAKAFISSSPLGVVSRTSEVGVQFSSRSCFYLFLKNNFKFLCWYLLLPSVLRVYG